MQIHTVSQLDFYDIPASTTVKDSEKQQCCLITEDLAQLGMATANSNVFKPLNSSNNF